MKFPADRALKPAYVTLSPNSSILLAEGRLKLSKDKITCEGSGLVRIKWRPSPNINFKMKCDISPIVHKELPMGPAKLEVIEENSLNFDVFVTRINNERKDGLIIQRYSVK